MANVTITLNSEEGALGFALGVAYVNDSAITVVSVDGCVVTLNDRDAPGEECSNE